MPDEIRLTTAAKKVIEAGVRNVHCGGLVQPEHVLLGLLDQTEIQTLLGGLGIDRVAARHAVASHA